MPETPEKPETTTLAGELAAARRENAALIDAALRDARAAECFRLEVVAMKTRLEAAENALAIDGLGAQRYAIVRAQMAFYASANQHLHGDALDAFADAVLVQATKRFRIAERCVTASAVRYWCAWCGRAIAPCEGHRHWRRASVVRGELEVVRMHSECAIAEGSRHALLRMRGWRFGLETRGVAGRRLPDSH